MFAADYPFLDVFWSMLVFFMWVVWIWILITVFMDLFRRHDMGGWAKAAWMVFVIVLPFLGVFVYIVTQGRRMTERRTAELQAASAQFDDRIRTVAATTSPTDQITKAKSLLDSGAIDQTEFDRLKASALA